MRSRQRYRRVSLILPSSISRRSSSAVDGYQRCSMANSLPGAQRRLIASNAATRDQGTSAPSLSMFCSKKQSSSKPLPKFQSEKAATEPTHPFQSNLVHNHLRYLRIVIGRHHMRRKQFQLTRFPLLVEHLNRLQPARLCRTVQLPQIADRPLTRTIRRAYRFHQRPVDMSLAILTAAMRTQKHLPSSWQHAISLSSG